MKNLIIILFLFSCTPSKTITLDGSASHAAPGKVLVITRWRNVNGNATIQNPNSLVTQAKVKGNTTFELYGQDNDSLSAKDSMNVIFIK